MVWGCLGVYNGVHIDNLKNVFNNDGLKMFNVCIIMFNRDLR